MRLAVFLGFFMIANSLRPEGMDAVLSFCFALLGVWFLILDICELGKK